MIQPLLEKMIIRPNTLMTIDMNDEMTMAAIMNIARRGPDRAMT